MGETECCYRHPVSCLSELVVCRAHYSPERNVQQTAYENSYSRLFTYVMHNACLSFLREGSSCKERGEQDSYCQRWFIAREPYTIISTGTITVWWWKRLFQLVVNVISSLTPSLRHRQHPCWPSTDHLMCTAHKLTQMTRSSLTGWLAHRFLDSKVFIR